MGRGRRFRVFLNVLGIVALLVAIKPPAFIDSTSST